MITLGKKYKDKEGKPVEEWFDEVNLVTLKGKTPKGLTKQPAGPSKSPPSRSVPTR